MEFSKSEPFAGTSSTRKCSSTKNVCLMSTCEYAKPNMHESFPPIVQEQSWTVAVPYKERTLAHTPSESIANNYSPTSQHLRIQHLTKRTTEFPELDHQLKRQKKSRPVGVGFQRGRSTKHGGVATSEQSSGGGDNAVKAKGKHGIDLPQSRPVSPMGQAKSIRDALKAKRIKPLNEHEQTRYYHYVANGVKKSMIEQPSVVHKKNVVRRLRRGHGRRAKNMDLVFVDSVNADRLQKELFQEVDADYYESIQKAIVDYILLDPSERLRVGVPVVPNDDGHRCTVRAPVPWQESALEARHFCNAFLFVGHPIVIALKKIWFEQFSSLRLIDISGLQSDDFCLSPDNLLKHVEDVCAATRNTLLTTWVPSCCEIFVKMKTSWFSLIPKKDDHAANCAEALFRCVSSLMSRQLRSIVEESLLEFQQFVCQFHDGNAFEDERQLRDDFFKRPLLNIELEVENDTISFRPPLRVAEQVLVGCVQRVVSASEKIPRVERLLFPEMRKCELFLISVREDEDVVRRCLTATSNVFQLNTSGPEKFLRSYDKYLPLISSESEREIAKSLKGDIVLKRLREKLLFLEETKEEIVLLRSRYVWLNLFRLDASCVNRQLYERLDELKHLILNHLIEKSITINKRLCESFEEMCSRAGETPSSTAELVELSDYLRMCKNLIAYDLKEDIGETSKILLFLVDFTILSDDDLVLNSRVFNWPQTIRNMIEMSNSRIMMRQNQIEADLRKRLSEFEVKVVTCAKELDALRNRDPPVLNIEEIRISVQILHRLTALLGEVKQELVMINEEETLLGDESTSFPSVKTMISVKEPYAKLWTTALNFTEKYEIWFNGPFVVLNADLVAEEVDVMWKTMYKLSKTFADHPAPKRIADNLRSRLDKFKQALPVLQMICNPGMQERHWEQVSSVVGQEVAPSDGASLSEMIEAGLPQYVQKMEEISVVATKEHTLEKSLSKMKQEWRDVHFEVVPYRESGVSILTTVDEVQLMLDDHILRVQTMRGSPYIKPLESSVKLWEDKLILMQDIVDAWLKVVISGLDSNAFAFPLRVCNEVQSTWLYLEPIFGSEDITKQMPVESRKFARVDQTWREIMASVLNDTRALVATSLPYMLQKLEENNRLLEEIQKGLNNYLDKKRLFFPRFFFLSNDELLEILSETKDPNRVQPHLKKCFEGINGLEFGEDDAISGMRSAEKERVPFQEKIYPAASKGLVEKWLTRVEQAMVRSLRTVMGEALEYYEKMPLTEWITKWPGQITICARCIKWTEEVTEAMRSAHGLSAWYREYASKMSSELNDIVAMVQQQLSPNLRLTLGSLIVIDVHARDVVNQLKDRSVAKVEDFNWVSQLRYYWRDDETSGGVTVQMVATEVAYGFEYLGNSSRLVITPLTDRCYRTLMGALKLNLGGAPEGPAGTGKTETVKDLAKAVAKQCVVFNCSEGLDYRAMGKFFKGLAQAGSWACFDEFNRIDMEVLSVVAQQIHSIQLAKTQGLTQFTFEDVSLSLNPTCAMFITMNPGYSGRQELPDNLKVLFRTVAMMVPDYAMIAEICLYSMGFVEARSLACKIVHTYRLCSEQLSHQHHYDYGLRAVKTVLITAGNLKLKHPDEDEVILVLRALRNVNAPKFLAQDVPLFEGIVSDLFPDVTFQPSDSSALAAVIKDILADRNMQPIPAFVEKILQIYDTLMVRHGFMLVGGALSGKTTAYQVLGEALSRMDGGTTKIMYKVINPKALTLGQLYGSFDSASHEWSDGVLARTFREFATSTSDDRKWIIFDGPVDAVWVENMNTALDDNKKLCLMNSEIIQMNNQMRLIFESADLEHASPATVSRCGMIYMEPQQLGWKALKESYLNTLPALVERVQRRMVSDMFDWLMPPALHFVRTRCQTFVELNELHLCSSTLRFYDLLLDDFRHSGQEGYPTYQNQQVTTWLQTLFLFAIVWGVGGMLPNVDRMKFDDFFRNLIYGNNENHIRPTTFRLSRLQMFPEKKLVFDYAFERKGNGQWVSWMDAVDKNQWKLFPRTSLEFIVPTDETARQVYFLSHCLRHRIPLLMVGPTGTGKSAITNAFLSSLPKNEYVINSVNFSARTSASQAHSIVMSRLDRRRKGVFGPQLGRKCVVFIDDLSLPTKEKWGSQPPIELLRQWLDHGFWYDRKDATRLELIDTLLVAAMGPPGSGRNDVSPRFMRHFFLLSMDSFNDQSLLKIFGSIVDWHFNKGYDPNIQQMSKALIQATLAVYNSINTVFLPTPAKSHYVFSLRDFSRVIRGILQVPSASLRATDKLIRLWIHEVYRSFHDRLVDEIDRNVFFEIVKSVCARDLRLNLDALFAHLKNDGGAGGEQTENQPTTRCHVDLLFFGNYMEPDVDHPIYDEIVDVQRLSQTVESYLREYNTLSPQTPLNFVPFHYALEHVSRLSRVLTHDRGHALLIGISGSGRRTAARMAVFMADMELQQVEISRNYGITEWRDDVKRILRKAGTESKPFVFLVADDNIKDEAFLEDINTILNTGDIPNLYTAEEKAEILEKMQMLSREMGERVENTPSTLYDTYVQRVRCHLHLVITMSPIGDDFRRRLRTFPALINCCTIDWFSSPFYLHLENQAWPDEALEMVADRYLSECDLDSPLKIKCVEMCQIFHKSGSKLAEKYFLLLRRRTYVTPTSYLEMIFAFKELLNRKRSEIWNQRNRYVVGLEKLEFAAAQVTVMQDELTAERPKLIRTTDETETLMVQIERDTINIEAKKEIVAVDEAAANIAAADAQAIKDECENDLAEATPALESAIAALNTLKPQDITVIKSMKNPPGGVKLVMEAICIMKGIKPERKPEPGGTGKMIEDFWGPSQKLLGDLKFLEGLRTYDKDNISPSITKTIRKKYMSNPDFDPNVIRFISAACEGLCRWICAIEVYDRVTKIVAPKKDKLSKATAELGKQMEKLDAKRSQLQEVTDKLQILNDEFIKKTKEKKDLEDRIELCCKKLDRAEKLIGGLGGEKDRWNSLASQLAEQFGNVVGDVLLSAGVIAYLGTFTAELRHECIGEWIAECHRLEIPCSSPYTLIGTLGNPVEIREWKIAGLPVDDFSVDNGIIVSHSRRWPLMIDPQGQANKWIRTMERERNLEVVRLSDPNYIRVFERCIQLGIPILLEDVREELDPLLLPLLLKQTFKKASVEYIRLADNLVEYSHSFRLYITTRLRNPHILPDVSTKVALLNFTITPIGLENQLLGTVVARERPELEEKKNELIVEGANNKRQLKQIEDKILEVLSMSEGNILEDETAIGVLSSSKTLSEEITAKQEVAAMTETQIDETRNLYRPVAVHSSTLFFCTSELAHIDPMYQYSLSWFMNLFLQAITNSPKMKDLNERTVKLNAYFTHSIYRNICRSLFEKDELVFACILCVGILKAKGSIDEATWNFVLRGGVTLDNPHVNPAPDWLTNKAWDEIVSLCEQVQKLSGLLQHISHNPDQWKRIHRARVPHLEIFPTPFDLIDGLQKIAILRCFRPDKFVQAMQDFISKNLGASYIEPPTFDLAESYADSNSCTPLIFVLSPGADPMADLLKFGQNLGYTRDRIQTLSLGQGQGPTAIRLIESALEDGSWVVLQNCHLVTNWLPTLEKLCLELIVPQVAHRNFRLWLTCYPTPEFPISILQNGIKMTNEPPRGLRPNLLRTFLNVPISDPTFFDGCPGRPRQWQRLLFGLCFFHALIQERQNFGPLGWNVPYEFNDSDLRISLTQLQMFLNDATEELPLAALTYMTGECNYGGRVTDERDRRLLLSLLSTFYNEDIVGTAERYQLAAGNDAYYVPASTTYESLVEYVRNLPLTTPPSVFGLNENANISRNNQEAQQLLSGLMLTYPKRSNAYAQMSVASGLTAVELVDDILERLPVSADFDLGYVERTYPVTYGECMNTVLQQEVARYSRLTVEIRLTVADVKKAVRGQVLMTAKLEEIFDAILLGRVPSAWTRVSYASLKPLGAYITDLLSRLKFFQTWIDFGPPNIFWISGFFFTQSFLTSILQNYARKHKISVDQLTFETIILKPQHEIQNKPEDGAFIYGLYLEGARWDSSSNQLAEPLPGVLHDQLPVIWLKPRLLGERSVKDVIRCYVCPVYKTSSRCGELSTTGHSTNYVFNVDLPTDRPEKHWINMGVACLCQLDN